MSDRSTKIFPRNLTARAAYQVPGNPVVTRPEDAVANCFPGLELDERNLDRRFFPGLVFEFVMWADDEASNGARLAYVDHLEDPDLQGDGEDARALFNEIDDANDPGNNLLAEPGARWYLDAITQDGKQLSLAGKDGDVVWRLVRSLEAKPVTIHLRRRGRVPAGQPETLELKGWRRRFTDEKTGVIVGAYQPGELMQSLCSPWQHDFRDCACHYWASNHPDVVYAEVLPGESLPGGLALDAERATERVDWLRADRAPQRAAGALPTMDGNRRFQLDHFQINHVWQRLNVVVGGTEVGPLWVPPTPDHARPFASPAELANELRTKLAPLEMALAFEYLYAMLSLHLPEEIERPDASRWPTLPDDLKVVRHYLLLTLASEMQHLRWANEILWGLHQANLVPGNFEPVLVPARTIPVGGKDAEGNVRARESVLRRLEQATLEDFIAVEYPSGFVDGAYARVIVTLRGLEYPPHLAGLAERIVSDGMEHESRFVEIRALLRAYPKDGSSAYPYLRKLEVGTWTQARIAQPVFREILDELRGAYEKAAHDGFTEAGKSVMAARANMQELLKKAEQLAARGIGLPLLDLPGR